MSDRGADNLTLISDGPTFGATIAKELREWRKANPAATADQFYDQLSSLAEHHLKMLSLSARPRFSKKVVQTILFDALAEACGKDPKSMTKPEQRVTAVALAQIRQACPTVDPQEIRRRAAKYRRDHPQWSLTPSSLCCHWSACGGGAKTEMAKRDIYTEPGPGWREAAKKRFPDALDWGDPHDFATMEWINVSTTIRPDILKAMG